MDTTEFVLPLLFLCAQVATGLFSILRIALNSKIASGWPALKVGIAVAKFGGALINLNAAFLIVSMCRTVLTRFSMIRLGSWLPIGHLNAWHRWSGVMLLAGSGIHCVAHMYNLVVMSTSDRVGVAHPTIILGLVLVVVYLMVGLSAYCTRLRVRKFEIFSYIHLLTMPSMSLLWLHGAFCFLRKSDGSCTGSTTLYWIGPPTVLYLVDTLISSLTCLRFSYISKVIQHPSHVIEIQMRKPSLVFRPGQFVKVCIPSVSILQWHPFTLTSAPQEDHVSIHVCIVGDWTLAIQQLFTAKALESVRVFIEGPFGCASQEYVKYSSIVCIGAGIGQTPFASILKSLWFHLSHPIPGTVLKSIDFVGICRNTKSFEWFNDILVALQRSDTMGLLHFHLYVTGLIAEQEKSVIATHHILGVQDPISGLKSPTRFGRPIWDELFSEWSERHDSERIGVFFCGPKPLSKQLKSLCKRYSTKHITFSYHKESF